jgi:hypothetical protein
MAMGAISNFELPVRAAKVSLGSTAAVARLGESVSLAPIDHLLCAICGPSRTHEYSQKRTRVSKRHSCRTQDVFGCYRMPRSHHLLNQHHLCTIRRLDAAARQRPQPKSLIRGEGNHRILRCSRRFGEPKTGKFYPIAVSRDMALEKPGSSHRAAVHDPPSSTQNRAQ